ncbi:MAG: hypothetical protein NTW21_39185 [Verrucomicrobia bacterium]|nr:hypothetical protein [Verrucomicrobiota bacterium]
MDTRSFKLLRLASAVTLTVAILTSTNCTTTYDAYGRPQQSVDPGLAIAGVAAAGLVGYAIANNNEHHHHNQRFYNHYYRPHY